MNRVLDNIRELAWLCSNKIYLPKQEAGHGCPGSCSLLTPALGFQTKSIPRATPHYKGQGQQGSYGWWTLNTQCLCNGSLPVATGNHEVHSVRSSRRCHFPDPPQGYFALRNRATPSPGNYIPASSLCAFIVTSTGRFQGIGFRPWHRRQVPALVTSFHLPSLLCKTREGDLAASVSSSPNTLKSYELEGCAL